MSKRIDITAGIYERIFDYKNVKAQKRKSANICVRFYTYTYLYMTAYVAIGRGGIMYLSYPYASFQPQFAVAWFLDTWLEM